MFCRVCVTLSQHLKILSMRERRDLREKLLLMGRIMLMNNLLPENEADKLRLGLMANRNIVRV
jgi:hypothetical protein